MRKLSDSEKVEAIRRASANSTYQVEIVEADLLKPSSWPNALKNVTLVIHMASPVPTLNASNDENYFIKPAVEGTLNVLNAAYDANVRRVVLTSSLAAMVPNFSNPEYLSGNKSIDESVRTNINAPNTSAYAKSKLRAEDAAWNFVKGKRNQTGKCFDLAVINPSYVFGPTFQNTASSISSTAKTFKSLLEVANSSAKPDNLYIVSCDVRGEYPPTIQS